MTSTKPVPIGMGDSILSDGTLISDLVDEESHTLSYRVFKDPEIYALELERLFARAWIVVAHESEVPASGDFVTRLIGADPVVVTRDLDGELHVLLNVCAHRGMQVCRPDMGNTRTLRCPFHGWMYDLAGRVTGVPAQRQMYGDSFDKSRFRLHEARVTTFAGMIWATWDEAAPTLDEYLGDFKFYMEVLWDRSDDGMAVVGPPQRWYIDANWKLAADQFACDAYHLTTLHGSLLKLGLLGDVDPITLLSGTDVSCPEGHGLRCTSRPWLKMDGDRELTLEEKLRIRVPSGMSPDMVDQAIRNLTYEQATLLANAPPGVGQVFPTAAFVNGLGGGSDGEVAGALSWRTWIPHGPARMEVMSWILVEKGASEEVKERTRKYTTQFFTDSGIIDQDDAEVWPGIQRAVSGVMGQRQRANYEALLGVNKPDDWPGGGLVYEGISKDDNEWNFWLRWRDFMTNSAW